MLEDIQQAFTRYGQSLIDGDIKATVDFMYPKIFKFIPKESIINSLKVAQNDPSVKISFADFEILWTEKTYEIDAASYVLFTSGSKIKMAYAKKSKSDEQEEESQDELEATYELLVSKYGEHSVRIDRPSNTIQADTKTKLLGVCEEGKWYFLDLKPRMIELYKRFLPATIISDLQKLFPDEEETAVKIPSIKKKRPKLTNDESYEKGNEKRIYLADWDVDLNGDQYCEDFIATHITTKQVVEHIYSGLELIFENDELVKVFEYEEGKKKVRKLEKHEVGLKYKSFPLNRIYQLEESRRGKHQLGGEAPGGFKLPSCNSVVPFQYLGYISNDDKIFNWLPFTVHLVCPIYLNIQNVFLDYHDPMNPKVINRKEIEEADTSYDELNKDSEIAFDRAKFDFVEDVKFTTMGNAGIPNWIQARDIPACPKSGRRMKFLCQLHGGVEISRSNVDDPNDYFKEMTFWGDGDLFVFFEPESKVACYFIQNT